MSTVTNSRSLMTSFGISFFIGIYFACIIVYTLKRWCTLSLKRSATIPKLQKLYFKHMFLKYSTIVKDKQIIHSTLIRHKYIMITFNMEEYV